MSWFKKNRVVYQIQGRERGHLEAYLAQKSVLEAQYLGLLNGIIEREKIAKDDKIVFNPELMAFVRIKK